MVKLGLSYKEVGRLTPKLFGQLYKEYRDNFDLELYLKASNKTYEDILNE